MLFFSSFRINICTVSVQSQKHHRKSLTYWSSNEFCYSHFGNEQWQFALVYVDFRFFQKLGPDKKTLYKTDTFWSHEGVRLRESWLHLARGALKAIYFKEKLSDKTKKWAHFPKTFPAQTQTIPWRATALDVFERLPSLNKLNLNLLWEWLSVDFPSLVCIKDLPVISSGVVQLSIPTLQFLTI